MEQGQCWNMWTKRKYSVSSNLASYEDSWEEQAFAEDAAGGLGGCTWPPRSYSCSFCSREFKSAQALGGHMNVHRRDRARLKQPRSPQNNEILYHHHQNPLNPSPTNPNSDPSFFASSPPSPSPNSKDLATSINGNICGEEIFRIPHNSPLCSSKSWSNVAEDRSLFSHKFDLRADNEKMSKLLDSDVSISGKRRRRTDASSVPFFPNSISVDHRHHIQSKMLEFSPSSIEELDLELRLGHSPKV